MPAFLLAIDQGTTNSRAILFSSQGELVAQYQLDLNQSYPHSGWVEQDPDEMWQKTLKCCQQVLRDANIQVQEIAALGISNQRETTILWINHLEKYYILPLFGKIAVLMNYVNNYVLTRSWHQLRKKQGCC